jgi:ribosome recycling factor
MTRIKAFAANALLVRTKPVKGSRLKIEEPAYTKERREATVKQM